MNTTSSNSAVASDPIQSSSAGITPAQTPVESQAVASGFATALVANLLWGSSFLASKYTLQAWGPFTASALRFALALLVMFIALPLAGYRIRFPNSKTEILGIGSIGLSGFGLLYPLQLSGLNFISSGLSAAIMLTSPIFVVGLSSVFLRENISQNKLIALGLGMLGGCVLIFGNGLNTNLGENVILGAALTIGASLSLASSVVVTRKLALKMDPANLTFWSMLVGLVLIAPFAVPETVASGSRAPGMSSLLALVYLAVVCSALCFLLWNSALSKASAKDLASTMHIKTPAAMLIGVMLANESVTLSIVAGTGVVAFAVWLSQKSAKPAVIK
jgi:drug/metabolite transporter (DMT)-like permease